MNPTFLPIGLWLLACIPQPTILPLEPQPPDRPQAVPFLDKIAQVKS